MALKVVRGSDTPATQRLSQELIHAFPVVTIGKFDGMHLGHKELFEATRREALKHENAARVLMTFAPHPEDYFSRLAHEISSRKSEGILMPVREKIRFASRFGFDYFYIAKFDERFIDLSCEEFFQLYLVNKLGARHIVVGNDWSFGRNRSGNIDTLKVIAAKHSITTEIVPPVVVDELRVSSQLIKELIRNGDVRKAATYLGRPYIICGCVKPGAQRGRSLGYPTANLSDLQQLVPGHGVYACFLELEGDFFNSVVNVGTRPTFDNGHITIEAHVIDKSDLDLYGKRLRLHFIDKLRNEKRFEHSKALAEAIGEDIDDARSILAQYDRDIL
jgi:riboflavin kinase/FMN adenylyltransferase